MENKYFNNGLMPFSLLAHSKRSPVLASHRLRVVRIFFPHVHLICIALDVVVVSIENLILLVICILINEREPKMIPARGRYFHFQVQISLRTFLERGQQMPGALSSVAATIPPKSFVVRSKKKNPPPPKKRHYLENCVMYAIYFCLHCSPFAPSPSRSLQTRWP